MEEQMILLFLVSLYICIILHELGHLLTAKLVGCHVEVFSIGFGKELYSFNFKGTKYRIALFPLGGYNQLKHELDYCRDKHALPNLTYSKKLLVLSAGCIINIVTGLIAFFIGLKLLNYNLFYFGAISTMLGITNFLPFPALDGSYPLLFLVEKIIPKKYALQLIRFLVKWGFYILMAINIACIPYAWHLLKVGKL
jgi:membrane-associated protease RseP (regulator of RpoE activity)